LWSIDKASALLPSFLPQVEQAVPTGRYGIQEDQKCKGLKNTMENDIVYDATIVQSELRIRDPVLFYPKDPGPEMIFFPDPGSRILNMTKIKF
jgi:hypothetical protein